MSILLADDDVHLTALLSKSLESEGYSVHTALDEEAVIAELQRQNYKLIILDLNFGQTDGLKLLERLRAEGLSTPVMVLSARNRVTDRIQSLNLGADDYVTKPFSFQELAARANALLRRKSDPSLSVLRVEDLEFDPAIRKVNRGDREIKLSPKEFELLHLMMRCAGHTVSRQDLLRHGWALQPDSDSNLVDVYVNYLRKKIDLPTEEKLIHTVRGQGYRLGPPAPTVKEPHAMPRTNTEQAMITTQDFPATTEPAPAHPNPWRALVNSVAHDLAQPLTSIRCFLEVAALRGEKFPVPGSEIKSIEQQADRAIALAKTIASLVRESAVPTGPWTPLAGLLEDVFNDFIVLLHSGMLTLERHWDSSVQVTSSPVLRQLLVLILGKLVGKNARPLTVSVTGGLKGSRCHVELRWRPTEPGPVQDSQSILGRDLEHLQEMVNSLGGEISFEGETSLTLKLPAHRNGATTRASETMIVN